MHRPKFFWRTRSRSRIPLPKLVLPPPPHSSDRRNSDIQYRHPPQSHSRSQNNLRRLRHNPSKKRSEFRLFTLSKTRGPTPTPQRLHKLKDNHKLALFFEPCEKNKLALFSEIL